MKRMLLAVLTCALAAVSFTGCTTVKHSFPDQDPSQVWTALIAVAGTPDYSHDDPTKRWFVKENRIAVFEDESRIEIYRKLERILEVESVKPRREERDWQFRVLFDAGDPPSATFVSRGFAVPMQAHAEGKRFFADVENVLAGGEPIEPAMPPGAGAAPSGSAEARPGERPIVDLEDLEPTPPGG